MTPVIKEQYEKSKITKEEADKIFKKAYNKRRDMLISVCIIIGLVIIGLISIFNALRNHAANALYERVYEYRMFSFETYYPEGEYESVEINGEEIKYDSMRSNYDFFEDNTMVWERSFDTDLSNKDNFTEVYVTKHSFEIRSDMFEGDPYIVVDGKYKLKVVCEDKLGQPISKIQYEGILD